MGNRISTCLMDDSSYKFPYNDNKMIKVQNINLFKQSHILRYTNGWSTDMTRQILSFFRSEFSVITDLTSHFFLLDNWERVC